jgi:hypothetical protein
MGPTPALRGVGLVALAASAAVAQPRAPSAEPIEAKLAGTPTRPEATAAPPESRYPRSVIDRPFSYPEGLAGVGFDVATAATNSRLFDPATLRVLAGYGITDKLEIGFGRYAFATSDAKDGSIDANIGYQLVDGAAGGRLTVYGRVQTGYSLARDGMLPLQLGFQVGYLVTPKFAVFTPGQQLSLAIAGDPKPIALSVPISAGIQAAEIVWVQLDAWIADVNISQSANAFIFADSTPLAFSSTINVMPTLDVILGINVNLTPPRVTRGAVTMSPHIADTIELMVGARYYLGKLYR